MAFFLPFKRVGAIHELPLPCMLVYKLADVPPAHAPVLLVPRPVLDECQPLYLVIADEPPETAIVGAVPVVSHHEQRVRRYLHRTEIVTGVLLAGDYFRRSEEHTSEL